MVLFRTEKISKVGMEKALRGADRSTRQIIQAAVKVDRKQEKDYRRANGH